MKTNREHIINNEKERGNALIYVLIAIALFAALGFTMSRQSGTGEAGSMPDDRAEMYATDLISYAAQVKYVIDQMLITGARINDLDFTQPSDATFNTPPHISKVYHPEGGGLNPSTIPREAIDQSSTDPVAGWYLGRFNNVEWTASAADDVILVAYQIARPLCEKLNFKVNGSTTIPLLTDSIKETMIDATVYTGVNADLTTDPVGTPVCAACHKVASLCVEDQGTDMYAFYTIIADQ